MLKGNSKGIMGENVREGKRNGLSERDAVMVSMKNSKKDSKSKVSDIGPASNEDYPYSSRLDLDHEMLGKLGIDKMPKHGAPVTIQAKGKVHRTSEDTNSDGKTRRSMTVQMTHMKVGC